MMEKKTICIDLDGVLAEYDGRWRGCDHIGRILEGSKEAVITLYQMGHKLVLQTTRLNPEEGNVDFDLSIKTVEKWLKENEIGDYFEKITALKPLADIYIDDRAIRFEGDWDSILKQLR